MGRHLFFLALSYLCIFFDFEKKYSVTRYLVNLIVASMMITCSVLIFNHEIIFYRGLSAVDWALYGILMVQLCFAKNWFLKTGAAIMFILFPLKITYQIIFKHSMFVPDMGEGIVNMPSAHITGALTGAACAAVYHFVIKKSKPA